MFIITDTLAFMTQHLNGKEKKKPQTREMLREKQTFKDLLLCVFLTFLI